MRRLTKLSIAAAVVGIGSLLISYMGGPSQAATTIDRTRDCDTVAIFYCGSMTEAEFHQKWNNDGRHKDHQTVFNAFGIKKDDVKGMVNGVVWRDGRVTLEGGANNGKVVATNAQTAGRWNNPKSDMTRIAGTDRAYKMSTRHFVTDGQAAMIKLDQNGRFLFAVIKSCGNPVTATPPPAPKPQSATCIALAQPVITNRTNVALRAEASTAGGATISGYEFTAQDKSGKIVARQTVNQTTSPATANMTLSTPGEYTIKVVAKTNLGDRSGAACEKKITISEPAKPGVQVDKKVDGVEHKMVGVDVEFKYNIRVTNTGETDLKQVSLTDKAPSGVTFLRASAGSIKDNSWTHTLSELKRGAHADFTITAKVPEHLAGSIKNTVCVDTPDVPGKPDDCDDATVEVPEPQKEIVCDLETKKYPVTIQEGDFNPELHSKNPEDCKEAPVPVELPKTGATDTLLDGLGIGALITSTLAYIASRRQSLI